jgi:hypothetical protein
MKAYGYLPVIAAAAFLGWIGYSQNANAATVSVISEDLVTIPVDNPPGPPTYTTGTTGFFTDTVQYIRTNPFGPASTDQYFSVQAGASATYDLGGPQNIAGMFWGSPDVYNQIDFYSGDPTSGGTLLASLTGADLSTHNGSGHDLVTVMMTGGFFDWVVTSSQHNAFEYSNTFSSNTVPIPGTLVLFASGLGVLGFVGKRNRRNKRPATAGAAV